MSVVLCKKPGTMCAEVVLDDVIVGEVEFMNYEPVSEGRGEAWRWRDHEGAWGNADTQEAAVDKVLERWWSRGERR